MRALLQRVSSAIVKIDGQVSGQISHGLLIFLGVTHSDTEQNCEFLADKCAGLRIFKDEQDKMNLSLLDVGGAALIVSQFTLYADSRKGRRPGYTDAALPEQAEALYEKFIEAVRNKGVKVETGRFGADMQVEIHNDGPVTLMVESKKI
ncbi:MAG: D-tyrosyl-tRNA(Tyr) deacylase [Victivallales bacterium]|nr:D-tyrosyl-tRNA(Tyr) deacylase [Victivallales bacterium]